MKKIFLVFMVLLIQFIAFSEINIPKEILNIQNREVRDKLLSLYCTEIAKNKYCDEAVKFSEYIYSKKIKAETLIEIAREYMKANDVKKADELIYKALQLLKSEN